LVRPQFTLWNPPPQESMPLWTIFGWSVSRSISPLGLVTPCQILTCVPPFPSSVSIFFPKKPLPLTTSLPLGHLPVFAFSSILSGGISLTFVCCPNPLHVGSGPVPFPQNRRRLWGLQSFQVDNFPGSFVPPRKFRLLYFPPDQFFWVQVSFASCHMTPFGVPPGFRLARFLGFLLLLYPLLFAG